MSNQTQTQAPVEADAAVTAVADFNMEPRATTEPYGPVPEWTPFQIQERANLFASFSAAGTVADLWHGVMAVLLGAASLAYPSTAGFGLSLVALAMLWASAVVDKKTLVACLRYDDAESQRQEQRLSWLSHGINAVLAVAAVVVLMALKGA